MINYKRISVLILVIGLLWLCFYIPPLHYYYTYVPSEGMFRGCFVPPLWLVVSNVILALIMIFVGVKVYRQRWSAKLGILWVVLILLMNVLKSDFGEWVFY